ncbi:MFS transporter [Verrucomicrobiales bacterium BCK34]|nr:MFS transporter [Verrucomicrobiales bacterium BCK34]
MSNDLNSENNLRWYQGITKYQWLVLIIASLGWLFDVFEGQIFVASMRDAMPDLLEVGADNPIVRKWNDWAFGAFLLGGALGGIFFGMLSDRIGRSKTMIVTILFYSMFTCVSAFSQEGWHMVALRFLVAMGVGGEWAVASAMVAEVMPTRSRAVMSSIFHASSVFGTLLAAAAIALLIGNPEVNEFFAGKGVDGWRVGFFIGVIPAFLTLWIRWKLKEPESWTKAKEREKADKSQATGRLQDVFNRKHIRNTFVGVSLATIGLVTFWGCHIYGKNALLRQAQADILVVEQIASDAPAAEKAAVFNTPENKAKLKRAEMRSMAINTVGGGLGLVLFGWISNLIGRKGAFILYHAMGFISVIVLFKVMIPGGSSQLALSLFLPVFGFFTLGMHAGYAVYFPELYPTRLRGTGSGLCFNAGRLGTAAAFFGLGAIAGPAMDGENFLVKCIRKFAEITWLPEKFTDEQKALWLAPLYVIGILVVFLARETRNKELME